MKKYEIDIRSRKKGNTIKTIFSGEYDEAMEVLNNWYKEHQLDINKNLEDYIDGSDGIFADYYVVEE